MTKQAALDLYNTATGSKVIIKELPIFDHADRCVRLIKQAEDYHHALSKGLPLSLQTVAVIIVLTT